jgi:hypothetical protein
MSPRLLFAVAFATIIVAAPACAQVYKWVDERGVTNYGNEPPADVKGKKKAAIVGDTISVYTPDKSLTDAVDARQTRRNSSVASERELTLERQLEAERRARQEAVAEAQAATAAAAAAREPPGIYSGTWYPYAPVIVSPRQRRTVPQVQLPPGAIAGNVVGSSGYIPGNSTAPVPTPRRP